MNNKPSKKECDSCRFIPAGISKRTGKPYSSFWVCDNEECPNYKEPGGFKPIQRKIENTLPRDVVLIEMVGDIKNGIKELNERLDKMADYLVEKLSDNQIGGKK